MKTLALLIALCLPTLLLAQEKLTAEQIMAAAPNATPAFYWSQLSAGVTSADQVRMAWMMEQQSGGNFNWTQFLTELTVAIGIIVRLIQAQYHEGAKIAATKRQQAMLQQMQGQGVPIRTQINRPAGPGQTVEG